MQFSDSDLRAVTPDIAVDSSITHGGARNRTADGTIYLKKEKKKKTDKIKQPKSVKVWFWIFIQALIRFGFFLN